MPDVESIPAADLPAATPVAIDTVLASIWRRYYTIGDKIAEQQRYRNDYTDRLAAVEAGTYRYSYSDHDRQRDTGGLARVDAAISSLRSAAAEVLAEAEPYEAEFARRGGWTRAYLVTNQNGHVHASRCCSTCYPTTRYVWLVDLSGADEARVIELAGSSACTVCYPDAPVETRSRPCQLEDPAVAAKRAQAQAAKGARDAAKAAKAIAHPDGTEIRLPLYGTIRTERTAEITYVDLGVSVKAAAELKFGEHMVPDYEQQMDTLLAALAHKRDVAPEELRETLAVKIDKKFKREYR